MGNFNIKKPIVLEGTVTSSETTEDVLVIASDNEVKKVPRSQFSGGGGSQNLDDTLERGNVSNGKNIIVQAQDNENKYTEIRSDGVQYTNVISETLSEGFTISPNRLRFYGATSSLQINTDRNAPGDIIYGFAEGEAGARTIATFEDFKTINGESLIGTGDITVETSTPDLDAVLNANGDSMGNAIDRYIFMKTAASPTVYSILYSGGMSIINATDGGAKYDQVGINATEVSLGSNSGTEKRQVRLTKNSLDIYDTEPTYPKYRSIYGVGDLVLISEVDASTSNQFVQQATGFSVGGSNPSVSLSVNYPRITREQILPLSVNNVLPDANGDIAIAIALTDNTTTAKTGSQLDADYPTAIRGTKVQCMNITTGAIIYEKLYTGWAQYAVTAVPD